MLVLNTTNAPINGQLDRFRIYIDASTVASYSRRRRKERAAACKWINNRLSLLAPVLYEHLAKLVRLLPSVNAVLTSSWIGRLEDAHQLNQAVAIYPWRIWPVGVDDRLPVTQVTH